MGSCGTTNTSWSTTCPPRPRAGQRSSSTWTTCLRPGQGAARAAGVTCSTASGACWPTTAAASPASYRTPSPGCRTLATSARAAALRWPPTARATPACATAVATGSSPNDGRVSCPGQAQRTHPVRRCFCYPSGCWCCGCDVPPPTRPHLFTV